MHRQEMLRVRAARQIEAEARLDLRRLGRGDAAGYRALRLEALRESPTIFSEDFAEASAVDVVSYEKMIPNDGVSAVVGAFDGRILAGMACLTVPAASHIRHKGFVWGTYVRPDYRGRELSKRIVGWIIEHARPHLSLLQTSANTQNYAARSLYIGLGFKPFGVEPRALRIQGHEYDEELFALDLDNPLARTAA